MAPQGGHGLIIFQTRVQGPLEGIRSYRYTGSRKGFTGKLELRVNTKLLSGFINSRFAKDQ